MANLAEAVDATETDWIISADLDDDIDYLTVEDEIVHVTANFPAQYQAATGTTSVPRIRVERGAGGTTAASHADTTALTPLIPPSSSGGGGDVPDPTGAPDGQVPTTASGVYSLETLPKDFYAQDTDPGAVGTGSVWKDTTSGSWWTRNVANDGWNANADREVNAEGDDNASAALSVFAFGAGVANGSSYVAAENGTADAGITAEATGGAAEAIITSTTETGDATSGVSATRNDVEASVLVDSTTTNARVRATATDITLTATDVITLDAASDIVLDAANDMTLTTANNLALNVTGNATVSGMQLDLQAPIIVMTSLPTADPVMAGQLWNDAGTLKVSAG